MRSPWFSPNSWLLAVKWNTFCQSPLLNFVTWISNSTEKELPQFWNSFANQPFLMSQQKSKKLRSKKELPKIRLSQSWKYQNHTMNCMVLFLPANYRFPLLDKDCGILNFYKICILVNLRQWMKLNCLYILIKEILRMIKLIVGFEKLFWKPNIVIFDNF